MSSGLGFGLFGINNRIDSYDINNIGIEILPSFQLNYCLHKNFSLGLMSFVDYSITKASKIKSLGFSLLFIIDIK